MLTFLLTFVFVVLLGCAVSLAVIKDKDELDQIIEEEMWKGLSMKTQTHRITGPDATHCVIAKNSEGGMAACFTANSKEHAKELMERWLKKRGRSDLVITSIKSLKENME